MNPEMLFGLALGITPPWQVTEVSFSKESNRLDIKIDFIKGSFFPCPVCGGMSPAYDTTEKEWRHLNFFQYEAYLHGRVPRVKCHNGSCGVKQIQAPWARAGSGFTLLFEALVMTLARDMPINVIATLFAVHDTRLWRIIHAYVEAARTQEDHSQVRRVGIDETSSKRGHDYVTLFFDLDKSKLLFGTTGKDNTTVEKFVEDLKDHGGAPENITDAAIDMSKAFIKGVKEQLPNAAITFDHFHVIKLMNEAVAKVRGEEAKILPDLLKGSRYLFLKNPENLTADENARFEAIMGDRHLESAEAYLHKLNLQDVYFSETHEEAEMLLTKWHRDAEASPIEIINKMAKTVKEHWAGILSHFDSKLTSGFLEGVNSLIQAAKARARGYRNTKNLIAMAYIIAGKLKFDTQSLLPTPTHIK